MMIGGDLGWLEVIEDGWSWFEVIGGVWGWLRMIGGDIICCCNSNNVDATQTIATQKTNWFLDHVPMDLGVISCAKLFKIL